MLSNDLEGAGSERVLVCAPAGRDALLTKKLLSNAHIEAVVCDTIEEVCARMREGAAAALLDERILDLAAADCLRRALREQGEWSDFPIVVFSAGGRHRVPIEPGTSWLGNVTFLDRPVQTRTMIAAVHAAVRARHRQYQARRAMALREQFLAMLGHELRNPLASIRLAIESMPSGGSEAAQKRHAIIDRQSAHLTRLVDDLLDVARVTHGKIALQRERVDVSEVVRSCFLAQRPAAQQAALDFSLRGADEERWVDGDRLRLEQIVNNLLSNAIKYTPSGEVVIELLSTEETVEIEVRDSGIGMTEATIARVFELFSQADESLDRSEGGIGLGLTVVRWLVELHEGTVEARSEGLGRGSSFVVKLPRVHTPSGIRQSNRPEGHDVAKTIVVVDDNEDLREMLGEMLVVAGHDVVAIAGDGREGLSEILRRQPDAAFVDLGLPGLDGFEVARRAREAGFESLLVAVSGYGQRDDRRRALAAGFDDHMKKPIDLRALEAAIRRGRDPKKR